MQQDHLAADEHPAAREPFGEASEERPQMRVDLLAIDWRPAYGRERVRHG